MQYLFFGEEARRRRDVMAGWQGIMEQLITWAAAEQPACYLRFADGEFWSLVGGHPKHAQNGDAHGFFPKTLGKGLLQVLQDAQANYHPDMHLLVGGCWDGPDIFRQFLERHGLFDRIPWCCAQAVTEGAYEQYTLRWLQALRRRKDPKVLVCNARTKDGCKCLDATWIEVATEDCWLGSPQVMEQARQILRRDPRACFLYAAGMSSEVWAWRLWREFPESTQVDVGHLFDPAFGVYNRVWTTYRDNTRWQAYERDLLPFIRGAEDGTAAV